MSNPPKDPAQEYLDAVHLAVGRSLSAWSSVEEALCWIFTTAATPHGNTGATGQIMAAFWAVESFRGKLNVIDAAIKLRCADDTECAKMWRVVYKRAQQKNSSRNELAHGTAMNFGAAHETYFVPSFFKNLMRDVHKLMAAFAANPGSFDPRPAHRLTSDQIDHRTQAFKMFKIRLDKFHQHLITHLKT